MILAKALKLKNKKIAEYNKTIQRMTASNSYDVDSNKVYNSKEQLALAEAQLASYVALKAAIHTTSEPIREKIFLLGELKNLVSRIQYIDTTEGVIKTSNRYGSTDPLIFKADISAADKDAKITELEAQIETIQDELDYFNATTELSGF
jgi:hypothetical protein